MKINITWYHNTTYNVGLIFRFIRYQASVLAELLARQGVSVIFVTSASSVSPYSGKQLQMEKMKQKLINTLFFLRTHFGTTTHSFNVIEIGCQCCFGCRCD